MYMYIYIYIYIHMYIGIYIHKYIHNLDMLASSSARRTLADTGATLPLAKGVSEVHKLRAHDDRAFPLLQGNSKRAYALSSYALTHVALSVVWANANDTGSDLLHGIPCRRKVHAANHTKSRRCWSVDLKRSLARGIGRPILSRAQFAGEADRGHITAEGKSEA